MLTYIQRVKCMKTSSGIVQCRQERWDAPNCLIHCIRQHIKCITACCCVISLIQIRSLILPSCTFFINSYSSVVNALTPLEGTLLDSTVLYCTVRYSTELKCVYFFMTTLCTVKCHLQPSLPPYMRTQSLLQRTYSAQQILCTVMQRVKCLSCRPLWTLRSSISFNTWRHKVLCCDGGTWSLQCSVVLCGVLRYAILRCTVLCSVRGGPVFYPKSHSTPLLCHHPDILISSL